MTVSMVDAMMIDTVNIDKYDVVAVYGSSFGSPQGPARVTPATWVRTVKKPLWCIYFPGCGPTSALQEARSLGVVGVIMDLESRYEHDPWSRNECATFGNYMRSQGMPVVLYCHQGSVGSLAPSFDGQWWPGMVATTPLGPRDAVQYNYAGGYDVSNCADWYKQSQPQPQQGDEPMFLIDTPTHGIWLLSGSMYVHIDDPAVAASITAAGVKSITIDDPQHDLFVAASGGSGAHPLTGTLNVSGSLQVS